MASPRYTEHPELSILALDGLALVRLRKDEMRAVTQRERANQLTSLVTELESLFPEKGARRSV